MHPPKITLKYNQGDVVFWVSTRVATVKETASAIFKA